MCILQTKVAVADVLIVKHFGSRANLCYDAVVEVGTGVGHATDEVHVVFYKENGDAFRYHFAENIFYRFDVDGVHARRWFVKEEKAVAAHEEAGLGKDALFAVGKCGGVLVQHLHVLAVCPEDTGDDFLGLYFLACFSFATLAGEQQGGERQFASPVVGCQLHVLHEGESRQELSALEEPSYAHQRNPVCGQTVEAVAFEDDVSGVVLLEA